MRNANNVRYALVVMSSLTLASCNEEATFTTRSGATSTEQRSASSDDAKVGPSVPEMQHVAKVYSTTNIASTSLAFNPSNGVLKQEFSLASRYENTDRAFSQISRQKVTKLLQQGTPGRSVVDTLRQADFGILDLLIVVDDSGSMSQEQINLSSKLAPLLEFIKNSDWRIGVVTTDPAKGCSRALIKKGDANIDQAFATAINAGLAGTGNEQGIRQAVAGLSCATSSFVRPKSTVAVLIVSDEDNCSNGQGCAAPYNSPNYLTDFLVNNLGRRLGDDARIYGLFWEPGKQCTGAAIRGTQYAAAVAATQGTSGSICDADYTSTLLKISQDVSTLLRADFTLSSQPDQAKAVVKVNGAVKSSGYSIAGNVLSFTELPPEAAKIEVSYSVGAVPMISELDLKEVPAPGTLVVQVNGKVLSENAYKLDNKTLKFNSVPDANADIKIGFLRNTALLNEFSLGAGIKEGSLSVRINGGLVNNFRVDSAGILTFDQAPTDGALITANFQRYLGPLLTYPVALAGNDLQIINATDSESGGLLSIKINSEGMVEVDEKDHQDGKKVVILYKNESYQAADLVFKNPILAESVVIESSNASCAVGQGIEISEAGLRVDCDLLAEEEAKVSFKYKVLVTQFAVPELVLWKGSNVSVFVNDAKVEDYTIAGAVVSLGNAVPFDAVVRIIVNGRHL